jgi:predicted HTH transcriptional regulator
MAQNQEPRILKTHDRFERGQQRKKSGGSTRKCTSIGCTKSTNEGKPFCAEHLKDTPAVQIILQEIQDQTDEQERVRTKGWKAVDMAGITAEEILIHLKNHGERTTGRLSRELNIDEFTIKRYVQALKNNNLVTTGRTNRGATTVTIIYEC